MLTGIALFRLHAQGETNVRRTMDNRSSDVEQFLKKVPVNLASVAPCQVRAIWLWFVMTEILQPGSMHMHFGSV